MPLLQIDDRAAGVPESPDLAPRPPRRRRIWRRVVLGALGAVLVVGGALFLEYRGPIIAYLTHWKGSPTHTEPYVPFDPAPELHIAAVGDVGEPGSRIDATGAGVARVGAYAPFEVLLLLGDQVYPDGDPAELAETVFGPFRETLDTGTDLLAILGNHDVKAHNADAQLAALGVPGHFWARTFGDVLLVGLDSTHEDDRGQMEWLERVLGASDARWKIVALHHPPYSAGYQGSDKDVRRVFTPVFARHGVQLVLSGHDHDYQRSEVIDGVTYIVSGAGADTRRTGEASFTAESFSWHHFVDIAVFEDHLVVRAVNQDARVADEAVITP